MPAASKGIGFLSFRFRVRMGLRDRAGYTARSAPSDRAVIFIEALINPARCVDDRSRGDLRAGDQTVPPLRQEGAAGRFYGGPTPEHSGWHAAAA